MRWQMAALALVVGVVVSLPASAATLETVRGPVFINHGTGFFRAASGTSAMGGDKVMANTGGRARLVYPDQCVVEVNPGSLVTVSDESPCRCKEKAAADPKELSKKCPAGFFTKLGPVAIGTAVTLAAFLCATGEICEENEHHAAPRERPASP